MPNGQTGLAEALAVPIKPTLPPRPSVSGLPRTREKAPVGPEQAEYPEDIVTGQPIAQELNEAWMDLQNYVGSMWTTYGINIQKPDPSSPAQGEAHRRYIEKLNKVQTLGATAQREAKAETAYNLAISRGNILAPSLKFKSFGERQRYAFPVNVFKGAVSQYNQDIQEFYRPEDKKQADVKVEEQKQALRNQGEILKQQFLTGDYSEEENKQYNEYIDTNVNTSISQVEANYVKWGERARVGLAVAEKEFPAFDELREKLEKEFTTSGYEIVGGKLLKKTGFLIGKRLAYEKGIKKYKVDNVTKSRVANIAPTIEFYTFNQKTGDITVAYSDKSKETMELKELLRRYIDFGGKYNDPTRSKFQEAFGRFYKGVGAAPTEREEVPAKGGIPRDTRENFRSQGWTDEQITESEDLGEIEIIE